MSKSYSIELHDQLYDLLGVLNHINSNYIRRNGNAVMIDEETELHIRGILNQMQSHMFTLDGMTDDELPDANDLGYPSYRGFLAEVKNIIDDNMQEVARALQFLQIYYGH